MCARLLPKFITFLLPPPPAPPAPITLLQKKIITPMSNSVGSQLSHMPADEGLTLWTVRPFPDCGMMYVRLTVSISYTVGA